jgi:hypothetical protein
LVVVGEPTFDDTPQMVLAEDDEVAERHIASPLDVPGVDLGLTAEEIVACVHESRRPAP